MSSVTVKKSLIPHIQPLSPVSNRYRSLRNWLEGTSVDPKVIAITSAEPLAGKSTTAANLALAFAQEGRKVLLIDGNLQRPAQNLIFPESGIPHLTLYPACFIKASSFGSLTAFLVKELLDDARLCYDRVVIDTPALLSSAEASLWIAESDGVLMVRHAAACRQTQISEALKQIRHTGVPVLGSVLNGAKKSGNAGCRHYS